MTMEATPALVVKGLTKSFAGRPAVRSFDLTLSRGARFGLVGPNGAGKTTTLSMLTGTLLPDCGRITLLGHSFHPDAVEIKRRIGVVPTEPQLFESFSGEELLYALGPFYRVDRRQLEARIGELLQFFDLESARNQAVAEYSHGMRKKLAVAAALLHQPEILFLDEPFEGMDPPAVDATLILLRTLSSTGVTIFLTSHRLDVIARFCTSAAILDAGELVWHGEGDKLDELEQRFYERIGEHNRILSWIGKGA